MHIGCCAYSYRDALQSGALTLEGFLKLCAEMDLDGVELTAYYFTDLSESYLHQIKMMAYRLGLEISGTAVGNSFTSPDESERRKQVQMTKDWIDRSVILGAPGIRVFAGGVAKDSTPDEAFDLTVACLKECADYGEKRGIMVALENHGGITATFDGVLRLVNAVKSDWLGVNLDLGNYLSDSLKEIAATAPYSVTAHAKVASGGATMDYREIVPILREAKFNGYLNIEYEEAEDPFVAVPAFVAHLREAMR